MGVLAALLLGGCAPHEGPQTVPPAGVDASKRVMALEACVARAQQSVSGAADAGVSAGVLAPINSSIADAQDAVDDAHKLLQQQKGQEATDRAMQGLEECERIDAMVHKARQDAAERQQRVQLTQEAETRLSQTAACMTSARQVALRTRQTTGKRPAESTGSRVLDSAETALKQARAALAQNDPKSALGFLDTAHTHCQTALAAPGAGPTSPVRRGP